MTCGLLFCIVILCLLAAAEMTTNDTKDDYDEDE